MKKIILFLSLYLNGFVTEQVFADSFKVNTFDGINMVNENMTIDYPIIYGNPAICSGSTNLSATIGSSFVYQWLFSTTEFGTYTAVSGAVNQTYLATNVGFYKVRITDGTGIPATSPPFKVYQGATATITSATQISGTPSYNINFNLTGQAPFYMTTNGFKTQRLVSQEVLETSNNTYNYTFTPDSDNMYFIIGTVGDSNGKGCTPLSNSGVNLIRNGLDNIVNRRTVVGYCAGEVVEILMQGGSGPVNDGIVISNELKSYPLTYYPNSRTGFHQYSTFSNSKVKFLIPPGTAPGDYTLYPYSEFPAMNVGVEPAGYQYDGKLTVQSCSVNNVLLSSISNNCKTDLIAYPSGGGYTFKWFKNNVLVYTSSGNSNTYTVNNPQDNGSYHVQVINPSRNFDVTSDSKQVTIPTPVYTLTSNSNNICDGNVQLTVSGGLKTFWDSYGVSSSAFGTNSTNSVLNVNTPSRYAAQTWDGQCFKPTSPNFIDIVSNDCNPVIACTNSSICGTNTNATLNVNFPLQNIHYQWLFSTTQNGQYSEIANATSMTHQTNVLGWYKVRAGHISQKIYYSLPFEVSNSTKARLLNSKGVEADESMNPGEVKNLKLCLSGQAPFTYSFNGSNYTTSSLEVTLPVSPTVSQQFKVINAYSSGTACGTISAISNAILVDVSPKPSFTIGTLPSIACTASKYLIPITKQGNWGVQGQERIKVVLYSSTNSFIADLGEFSGNNLAVRLPANLIQGNSYKFYLYATIPYIAIPQVSANFTITNTSSAGSVPVLSSLNNVVCDSWGTTIKNYGGLSTLYNNPEWQKQVSNIWTTLPNSTSGDSIFVSGPNASGSYRLIANDGTCDLISEPFIILNTTTYSFLNSQNNSNPVILTSTGQSENLRVTVYGGSPRTHTFVSGEGFERTFTVDGFFGWITHTVTPTISQYYTVKNPSSSCGSVSSSASILVKTALPSSLTLTTPSVVDVCPGGYIDFPYNEAGPWVANRTLSITLVTTAGVFVSNLGSSTANPIKVKIPSNISLGQYKIKVVGQFPAFDAVTSSYQINVVTTCNTNIQASIEGQSNVCSSSFLTALPNGNGYSYQWYKNGTIISGATNYYNSVTQPGNYSVVVTNSSIGYNSTSNAKSVVINTTAPIISSINNVLCGNSPSVMLTTSMTGSGYIWQKYNPTNYTFSTINNQNSNTLTLNSLSDVGQYRVIVGTSSCDNISNLYTVTTCPPPSFTIQNSACYYPTLTASPSGAGYTYQWKKDGVDISGATSQTYYPQVSGNYSVNIQNTGLSYNSTSTQNAVTVNAITPLITSPNAILCGTNTSATLTSSYTGVGYVYTWRKSPLIGGSYTVISGATNSSVNVTQAGRYQIQVNNGTCTFSSADFLVTYGGGATLTNSLDNNNKVILTVPTTTENLKVNLTGTGPWEVGINDGSTTKLYTANTSPLIVPVSPTSITNYYISSVVSACGVGISSGQVQVEPAPVATWTFPTPSTLTVCRGNSITIPYTFTGTLPSRTDLGILLSDPVGGSGNIYSYTGIFLEPPLASGTFDLHIPSTMPVGSYRLLIGSGYLPDNYYTTYAINVVNTSCPAVPTPMVRGYSTNCNSMGLAASMYGSWYHGNANTYQWYKNGVAMIGKTSEYITVYESGNYSVQVINGAYNQTSAPKSVTINRIIPPITSTVTELCGTTTSITLSTSFTGVGYSYQWYKDQTFTDGTVAQIPIFGQSTTSYTATSVGGYSVKVFDGSCLHNSASGAVDGTGSLLAGSSYNITACTAPCTAMVSTKSGNWNDITVWSCGRLPLATDPVEIAPTHTVTLNANGVVKSLDLKGILQKQTGFTLQVQGN